MKSQNRLSGGVIRAVAAFVGCFVVVACAASPHGDAPATGTSTEMSTAPKTVADPPPPSEPTDFVCAHRFGLEAPQPRPEGTIRLATYNIENFFDWTDDPALEGEYDDDGMKTTEARCEALAAAIRRVNADVIALQEVESLEALTWFRDRWLSDMGYEHVASIDVGYYRGIENAVLSRFPITDAQLLPDADLSAVTREGPGWSDIPEESRTGLKFQRRPLQVSIETHDGYDFTMIVLHHKSGSRNRFHREAEALRIVEHTDALQKNDPSRNIVVLGDFNAAPWDKSLRLYLEHGFVDTLAHRIIPHWQNADQTEARLTKTHQSDRVIDFVLLNAAMYREFIVGSAHVYGAPCPEEGWDWRSDPHPPGYTSDHFPVIIDLQPRDVVN